MNAAPRLLPELAAQSDADLCKAAIDVDLPPGLDGAVSFKLDSSMSTGLTKLPAEVDSELPAEVDADLPAELDADLPPKVDGAATFKLQCSRSTSPTGGCTDVSAGSAAGLLPTSSAATVRS